MRGKTPILMALVVLAVMILGLMVIGDSKVLARDQQATTSHALLKLPDGKFQQIPVADVDGYHLIVSYPQGRPGLVYGMELVRAEIALDPVARQEVARRLAEGREPVMALARDDAGRVTSQPFVDIGSRTEVVSRDPGWYTLRKSCGPGCPENDPACCEFLGCSGTPADCWYEPVPIPKSREE